MSIYQGRKNPGPIAQGKFALGGVKIDVQWPGGQVKLATVVL